jgi:proline iminopeptidase
MRRRSVLALAIVTAVALSGQVLEAQRARQGLFSLEDARLFYEVIGTGDPIVIVHGGPGLDHSYLQPGLNVLAARNTLIYYDQRGTGRSEAELDSSVVNFDAFVDDIDALRQVLEHDKITVLTHSFGTLLGIEYARRYPDHLTALILMSPTEPGTRFADQTRTRQAAATTEEDSAEMRELTATEAFQARDAATLSQVYRVAFRATFRDRARVEELELDLSERTAQNGQAVERLLGESLGMVDGGIDWWDRLADIAAPTLVVHGRFDIPPVAMARALSQAIPRGSLAVLNSGHFPYIEDAGGLTSAIAAFLGALER